MDSPYRPGNFMLHVPVVVRSRTMAIVEQYFELESQHALVRSKYNMQFEYRWSTSYSGLSIAPTPAARRASQR